MCKVLRENMRAVLSHFKHGGDGVCVSVCVCVGYLKKCIHYFQISDSVTTTIPTFLQSQEWVVGFCFYKLKKVILDKILLASKDAKDFFIFN